MDLKEFLAIEAKIRKEHPELEDWEVVFIMQLVLEGFTPKFEKEVKDEEKSEREDSG